jgi:hypothetical protein
MLFLLNTQVLDVSAEAEELAAEASAEGRMTTASLYRSVLMGQRVLFAAGSFAEANPAVVRRIAASIAMASEANAALFVVPPAAKEARDVAVRLGAVPLTTMAHLLRLQRKAPLTPGIVNRDVWAQVEANQNAPRADKRA